MPNGTSDQVRAQQILETYGGEVDDFFKIWPPDKKYFFSEDKKAFIAYGVHHKTAVGVFDPVGEPKSIPRLIKSFANYCQSQNWQVIFIQTTEKHQKAYVGSGFHQLLIGADAFIDTRKFHQETLHNKYFRNLANRIEKQKYALEYNRPPHSNKLLKELRSVSDDWLTLPNHKEWSFLAGRFAKEYLQETPIFVLRDHDKKALAFANELPSYRNGVISVDLMRHYKDAPPNTMDFLFMLILERLHQQRVHWFNLGISPLAGNRFIKSGWEKVLNKVYDKFQRFIGFRGLHQFKTKWQPEWEPRYIFFTGSAWHFPQIAAGVLGLLVGSNKPKKHAQPDMATDNLTDKPMTAKIN